MRPGLPGFLGCTAQTERCGCRRIQDPPREAEEREKKVSKSCAVAPTPKGEGDPAAASSGHPRLLVGAAGHLALVMPCPGHSLPLSTRSPTAGELRSPNPGGDAAARWDICGGAAKLITSHAQTSFPCSMPACVARPSSNENCICCIVYYIIPSGHAIVSKSTISWG